MRIYLMIYLVRPFGETTPSDAYGLGGPAIHVLGDITYI